MPTPEQWQQYAETQNKYRYGQPTIGPKRLIDQPVNSSAEQGTSLVARPNADIDPLELTDAERRRAENNRNAVNNFFSNLLPTKGIQYNKYGKQTPIEERRSQLTVPRPIVSEVSTTSTKSGTDTTPVLPKPALVSNGYSVAGSNTLGRAGYTNKIYYDPSGNIVASGLSSATGRGGFVGASTDAQAAKALQDRAEQNVAAQFNIDNMNRAADAERDLRAARLGVSRGVLDRMEGRNDTAAAAADSAAQGATPDRGFNPLSMPGDSFQDTRGRQAEYDRAVEQVLTGNAREQNGAAATLTALNDLKEKNLAAQVAQNKTQTGVDPIDMNRFLLDQQKFNYQQKNDTNRFLLDEQKFNYQQGLDKERLAVDKSEAEGKQAERQFEKQKYTDESRKAFVSEFSFSDPKAPREKIAGAVFDISQATGVPTDVVSQIYEQSVKELGIDYGKGGPKNPMDLNELVAARVTQAYRGQ